MGKQMSKNRANKKILAGLQMREEQILNLVFMEFMKCLKPKPALLPLVFLRAFLHSLVAPKKSWESFTRSYVYDLSKVERMSPEKIDSLNKDIEKSVAAPKVEP